MYNPQINSKRLWAVCCFCLISALSILLCGCSKEATQEPQIPAAVERSDRRNSIPSSQIAVRGNEVSKLSGLVKPELTVDQANTTKINANDKSNFYPSPSYDLNPNKRAPTYLTTQIVRDLVRIVPADRSLTQDEVDVWNQRFQELVDEGEVSLPAIREFLDSYEDVAFRKEDERLLGHPTARLAMIDALQQIGGSQARMLLEDILFATADPQEIALLARALDEEAPGEYREAVVAAAREALAMARGGAMNDLDVGPLFDVISSWGDETDVSTLGQSADQWRHYGLIGLANLTDGVGIPSLVAISQNEGRSGMRSQAQVLLAQVATQSGEAQQALIEAARWNQITQFNWRKIANSIEGDFYQLSPPPEPGETVSGVKGYHIQSGNQNFHSDPTVINWSEEEINRRVALVDQLLSVNSNPFVVKLLQETRSKLENKPVQVEIDVDAEIDVTAN